VLFSNAVASQSLAHYVSENLRKRWIKYGPPAVEFLNVISPFASSFELLAHSAAGNQNAAVELIELMWGYMLDGPGIPGIKLLSPLGKAWEIEPHLTKRLTYARGGFATKLGKFEVSISLMRSLSTSPKIEALNITVPAHSGGIVKWGGKSHVITTVMTTDFGWYRYLDITMEEEEKWRPWSKEDANDFVEDETWVKPTVEERPKGVVNWEALEENYLLAEQRFRPFG
jgi:hypothetical protein